MKTIAAVGSFIVLAVGPLAEPAFSQNGPKNLMSPTYRAPIAQAAVPHELTRKQVKRLAATAESAADHLKLANLLSSRGNSLEARAAAYEKAAATLRNGPLVKNLTAPSTPGRYEFIAKGFRDEAKSDRSQAAAHEEMAGKSRASKSRGVRRSSMAAGRALTRVPRVLNHPNIAQRRPGRFRCTTSLQSAPANKAETGNYIRCFYVFSSLYTLELGRQHQARCRAGPGALGSTV